MYSMFQPLPIGLSGGLPVHLRPSPTHPGAQSHLKLPAVLVQVACLSQLWAPISHSFISERKKKFVIQKNKQILFDGLMVLPGFLALRSALVRALDRQQRTRESFWVSVFIHQDPNLRAGNSPTLTAFLRGLMSRAALCICSGSPRKLQKGLESETDPLILSR